MIIIMPNYSSKFFYFCLRISELNLSIESLEWTQIADYPIDQDENGPTCHLLQLLNTNLLSMFLVAHHGAMKFIVMTEAGNFFGRMTKPRQG